MANTTSTVKVTKKDMFNAIKAACADNASIVEFCDHEIELLSRKSKTGKLTKTQEANVEVKKEIVAALERASEPVTISQLIAANTDTPGGYTSQKISALMSQLVKSGEAVRVSDKRTSYFTVPEAAEEEEEEGDEDLE